MACVFRVDSDKYSLAVWEVTESREELSRGVILSGSEKEWMTHLKNEKRILELLASRVLLKMLCGDPDVSVSYDSNGKPHPDKGCKFLSIAHSREYVAVIISDHAPVGIDIEKLEDRIEKIAHKFVNDSESVYIKEEKRREALYLIWGAKETMFKLYSKGELDFKKNMSVDFFKPMQRGDLKTRLTKKEDNRIYDLHYELNEKWMLVYGSEEE